MIKAVSHIALFVTDLQVAEKFYQNLFDMELIGREVEKEDGCGIHTPSIKVGMMLKPVGLSRA